MGFWRSLLGGGPALPTLVEGPALQSAHFAVDVDTGVLYGSPTLDELITTWGTRKVTRQQAISVPAIKRGRDLIAGGLGSIPIRMYDQANKPVQWNLFEQPEEGVPASVTWSNVVDDLIFSKFCYLRVTHLGWHGKPVQVIRLEPETVTIRPDLKVFHSATGNGTATTWIPDQQIIRIESPNDPLLVAGARAIRTILLLDAAAQRNADGVPPLDYFTPADGYDPATDVSAFLGDWEEARRTRSTGYIPAALNYHSAGWNPEQLQMIEQRQHAVLEIARLMGVDPEELGVSTTSRTYANQADRRRQFVDFCLGPYMRAIEGALSLDAVTPRGYRAAFDFADFTKESDLIQAQTDQALIDAGILTPNEARARRGLEAIEQPRPAQEPQEQQEPAHAA